MTYAHARTPDMSLEEYDRVRAAIGPEPIDGNLEHHVGLEDGALCRRRQVVVEGPDRPVRRDTALPGLRRRRGTPRRRADHLRLRLHRPQLTDLADPLRVAPGRRALQPVDRDRRAPRPPRPRRPLECRPRYAPTVTRLGMRVRGGMPAVVVGLRWTTKSLRHLTDELTGRGHRVSAPTVAALAREENFSLRGNAKTISRSVTTLVSATAGPVQQSFTLSLAPTSGSVKRGGRRRRRRRRRGSRVNGPGRRRRARSPAAERERRSPLRFLPSAASRARGCRRRRRRG